MLGVNRPDRLRQPLGKILPIIRVLRHIALDGFIYQIVPPYHIRGFVPPSKLLPSPDQFILIFRALKRHFTKTLFHFPVEMAI